MNTISRQTSPAAPAVIAYYRVSTEKQGANGLGIDAQKAYLDAYCARTGATILRSFTEVESGRKTDRPQLAKAIMAAKRAKATLVIAKLDRLARNVAFVANLMETRVEFESCDLPNANSMTIHVMAAVAENEAKAISQRTKDALSAAKARGVKLGADRDGARGLTAGAREKGQKLGQETNRKKAVEEYADVLPIAQAMRKNGSSYLAIAKHLNSEGFRTRRNADWSEVQVFRLLKRCG